MTEDIKQYAEKGIPPQIVDRLKRGAGCWSDIPDGWVDLVVELDKKLNEIQPDYSLDQVKEKWGGLRYYLTSENDAMSKLVEEYEKKSLETCEVCGKAGRPCHSRGWIATRCSAHQEDRMPCKKETEE
jgi:hypothetical protein